jgi:hypothetical protein
MSTRNKIKKFCRERGYKILTLECYRVVISTESPSYWLWEIVIEFDNLIYAGIAECSKLYYYLNNLEKYVISGIGEPNE